jgi:hypothetical protein
MIEVAIQTQRVILLDGNTQTISKGTQFIHLNGVKSLAR